MVNRPWIALYLSLDHFIQVFIGYSRSLYFKCVKLLILIMAAARI